MTSSVHVTILLFWLSVLPSRCSQGALEGCERDVHCGWNSFCEGGKCICIPGHKWSSNNQDCVDLQCHDSRCLDCTPGPDKCRRCVDYIEESTGRCIDHCHGSYMLVIEGVRVGKVCPVSAQGGITRVYMAIIIGIGAGIAMSVLAALCFYWQTRDQKSKKLKPRPPTRNEIETVQTNGHTNKASDNVYSNGYVTNGSISNGGSFLHYPSYENPYHTSTISTPITTTTTTPKSTVLINPTALQTTTPRGPSPPRSKNNNNIGDGSLEGSALPTQSRQLPTGASLPADLSVFRNLLAEQRLYVDTFLTMLRDVKERNMALPEGDNRALVYRNVIHQLCRVLTLLNSGDEYIDVPSDGVLLFRWSNTLLHKYLTIKDPEYWEPGTPVGTITSTFKPDLRLIPNGQVPGTARENGDFKYERCDPDQVPLEDEDSIYRDLSRLSIQLEKDFTEPIEV